MTVLQALDGYYARMAARGEAEAPGFSREKIGFAIVLTPDGQPVDLLDLREAQGKRLIPRLLEVPAAVKRTAGVLPNLLWDKTSYVLGRTAGEGRRTAEEHAAFKAANLALLKEANDEGLVALRRFLETWTPERLDAAPFTPDILDTNVVFSLAGEQRYIHQREAARRLIDARAADDTPSAFCLVTGVQAPVRRLHPSIKGVEGAQSSGAALVSFNLDAFTSYGKSQGDNAPTSEAAAFRYGAALNRMLDRDSRNRLPRPLGDASVVFWADASVAVEEPGAQGAEDVFGWGVEPPEDSAEAAKVRTALELLAAGQPVERDGGVTISPGVRFHVLGLSPNAARLSVRFWLTDSLGVFAKRLNDHYRDIHIAPSPWRTRAPSIQRLLVKTTALQEKFDNIPPLLAGEMARAVLSGAPYPRTLLVAALTRLRAGDDPGTGWHAAAIKACINRAHRFAHPKTKEPLSVSLDPDNPSAAYQLGRLFAVLESAQYAALGRVNASIADRYYGAASSTPARVFGALMRSAQNHISDAKRRSRGLWIEAKLTEIIGRLPPDLPTSLMAEDQGRFAVGYYHERGARPAKGEETNAESPIEEEHA